jgi:hypothetical protein
MSQASTRIRRDILTARVVKGRIHQNTICARRREPRTFKRVRVFHVKHDHFDSTVEVIEPRIVGGERAKDRVDLDECHLHVIYACRKREARCTDTSPQIDHVLTAARSGCRGQQNCVMTDSVAAHGLSQT